MAPKKRDEKLRFWEKVDKSGDCWMWIGNISEHGYGTFNDRDRKKQYAHRVALILGGAVIPTGLHVDHICHVRACVRPDHLRVVTPKQNLENRSGAQVNNLSSGVRGVTWHKRESAWFAQVHHNKRCYSAGYHATIEAAAESARLLRLSLFTHSDMDRQ